MRGRRYLNGMIRNSLHTKSTNDSKNNAFKQMIIENQIQFIKNGYPDIGSKVNELKDLTHDLYRVGYKYKYDCSLTNSEISMIICSARDDKLHLAYFGKTIADSHNMYGCYLVIGFYILFFIWLIAKVIN